MSSEQLGPLTGTTWSKIGSARTLPTELERWIREFLCQPHAALGRSGAVCPFTRAAVENERLWIARVRGAELNVPDIARVIEDAGKIYRLLATRGDPESAPQAVVTIFPDLADYGVIDTVHARCKSAVVERGAMLGQFYPGCAQQGLWNEDFRPLDAPVPMLVVRPMTVTDYPFLVGERDWLYSYFTKFAPHLPVGLRCLLADDLVQHGDDAAAITRHARQARNAQAPMAAANIGHES